MDFYFGKGNIVELVGTGENQQKQALGNIEFSLVNVYRDHEKLTDYGADYVIETLVKQYTAELLGRTMPPVPKFQPHEQEAYDSVKAMCDWRLGRGKLEDESGQGGTWVVKLHWKI